MHLAYAEHYAKSNPDDPAHRNGIRLLNHRILAPLLPADRSAPILDVGCGRGYAVEDVRALGYTRVEGIEPDPGQVEHARKLGIDVALVPDTVAYLAAKPGAYAVILLMDVLEHVPRERQPDFLHAISRSLAPGGRLICSVPNAASSIASYWLHNDYTHHWSFTVDSLSVLLTQCGFERVACRGVEFFLRPRFLFWLPSKRTLSWLLRCVSRSRRRADYIAELGWDRGWSVVLTPNLLATAERKA